MRRLGLLLCVVLTARAGDEPLVRIFDVADLKADDTWFELAMARARAAAGGVELLARGDTIVVAAPAAVQERVAKELLAVREAFRSLVRLDLRILKVEGSVGVASVPVEKLDAFLKEAKAKDRAGPTLVCRNGQQGCLQVSKQISCVTGFSFATDPQGRVVADPVVETLSDGLTAKLRPVVTGQIVRVAADISIAEVTDPMPEIELPLPLPTPARIQVPEGTTRSVRKVLDCGPAAFTVVDLGGGHVVLIRASPLRAEEMGGSGGEERQRGGK